jgi:hypothetical protein
LFSPWSTMQHFQHPCFENLTHLHLYGGIQAPSLANSWCPKY